MVSDDITLGDDDSTLRSQASTSELAVSISQWMNAAHSFFYVEVASLVLLFACVAVWVDWDLLKYALSVACVSLGICLLLQTAEFLVPGFLEWKIGEHSLEKLCSVFMMIWWTVGTGVITFKGPFYNTSNGWFAAWGGFVASVYWCIGLKSTLYSSLAPGVKYLINLVFCSIVLLFSCIPHIRTQFYLGGAAFGVAGASMTVVSCAYLVMTYDDIPRNIMKLTVVLLFVLWACVAGVCTFHGPFLNTGNGYFSCWLGLLCNLKLVMIEMGDQSPMR